MDSSSLGHPVDAPGPADALPAGTRLGEYEIERAIGSGGMGTVYAAWHPVLRGRAAVKVLNLDVSHNAAMVERFVSEAQAASRISHPNIIKVFGLGELPDGRKYFVMEYLEGETMAAWLAMGSPDPSEALDLLLQVCEALEAAHREGIVHRDLKPDNLWIARPKHGRPYIKILDFGIAKAVEGPLGRSLTKTGSLLGTPQFMSPEQCTGRGVDHRTDIYALGGILYCVYCGRPPFERESPAELVAAHLYSTVPMPSVFSAVPAPLERLILACLEKDPDKRPQSAAELAARLRAAAAPAAIAAMAAPSYPTPSPTARLPAATAIDAGGPGRQSAAPEPPEEPGRARAGWGRPRWRWPLVAIGVAALGGTVAWLATHGGPAPRALEPVRAAGPAALPIEAPPAFPALAPVPPRAPSTWVAGRSAMLRPRQPASKGRPRVPKATVPAIAPQQLGPPSPPPAPPSRTTREGLIEENPFR